MKKFILTITLLVSLSPILYAQWEILNEGFAGYRINTIDFVSKNVGWMAGDRGIVLKTTDGGETWQTTKLNENWYITQIDFIDDSVGWAVGYHNILKTEDGGYNWVLQKKVPDFYLYSIYAVDKNNVYAAYDKIYKTTNGGADWIDAWMHD